MKLALFGGTFDPIHSGHLRAARAAARRFGLDRILFVPSANPPHKVHDRLTAFHHRFTMVALACAREPRFVPSLLEAPGPSRRPQYTIETVRKVKSSLDANDRLFFLIGADAFLDLPHWKDFRRLLSLVEFIVVSRPGFQSDMLHEAVSPGAGKKGRRQSEPPRPAALHILHGLHLPIASRDIRHRARDGRPVAGLVPALVEEYMKKEGLYRPARLGQSSP